MKEKRIKRIFNMRLANRQHPPHLQVTRIQNGKFVVSQNGQQTNNQDVAMECDEATPPPAPSPPTTTTTTTPVVFPSCETRPTRISGPSLLGDRFLLVGPAEGSALYRCVDVRTGQQLVAKALTASDRGGEALVRAHMRLADTGAVSCVVGIVDAPGGKRYMLFEGHHGDLHAYVRARRRLREPEARRLFRQAAEAVAKCHENGVVLRDLKLRKFVFADEARTRLRLESLEDAVLVEEHYDRLTDRRGCPAYVAPEVLRAGRAYSGKAADMWSLGVVLYTMLVGRYPFNDVEHASLFAKILRGLFILPDGLSSKAKCLIRALLRKDPSERPESEDVVRHPWLTRPPPTSAHFGGKLTTLDYEVPQSTNYFQD